LRYGRRTVKISLTPSLLGVTKIAASNIVDGHVMAQCNNNFPVALDGGLKGVMMVLGNKLVTEHRFEPGPQPFKSITSHDAEQLYSSDERRTAIITLFTEFVNKHEEAQQVLKELGFAWPVVERPHAPAE
jgi:hypothetical protein